MIDEHNQHNNSLQQHLTNSIRRAKERIYNNAFSNYSSNQFSISHLNDHTSSFDVRNRASSHRQSQNNLKEDKSVLASAMKTLQQKIFQLEMQNKQLRLKLVEMDKLKQGGQNKQKKQQVNISRFIASLREKQQEILKLSKQKNDLIYKNAELKQKIDHLEDEIIQANSSSDQYSRELVQNININQKEMKIKDLQAKIFELEKRNINNENLIQNLNKKLDQQKKINMRWIKLHQSQIGQAQQKQNNSLEINTGERSKPNRSHKKYENNDLIRKNKEMYETIQRNKIKLSDLSKECKLLDEKYNQMKLIALQIAENVNKILPHQSSHIKYLTTKVLKLQNSHVESLRGFNIRRSRMFQRNSNSKQRKRSLKMSDLALSDKKSCQRSRSKSHKKKQQIIEQQITKSEKKPMITKQQEQMQQLQKQVLMLMKKYRNFVARSQKDKSNEEINKKLQITANEYNQKKSRLEQLKKNINAPMKMKIQGKN